MNGSRITITRDGADPVVMTPASVEVGAPIVAGGHVRLRGPAGWRAEALGPGRWRVWPVAPELDREATFLVEDLRDGSRVGAGWVALDLDLRSSFDPTRHALPLRNRASELGEVSPRREIFERTVTFLPEPLRRVLFAGLYADIVFLKADGSHRGGMCSGMARWALARGLGDEPEPATTGEALERIQLYHGRQLRDRALLSAAPWFFRASPRAAYRAVRRDLLREGITDRALDLAIPKPWRLDLAQALVREGHTVVPYRLRQRGPARADVEVYDPNHPAAVNSDAPRVVHFDLERDRYAYGRLVALEQSNVGMIAVRQAAYRRPGTAFLATLASFVVAPGRALRALLGARGARDDART